MRTFVIGDIHGAYKALVQCLQRSGFDRDKDRLVVLGDVCDVFPEVRQCVDLFLELKHCDYIIGNHDIWALDWSLSGIIAEMWRVQGGDQTMLSYGGKPMPSAHLGFFNKARHYLELNGMLFVHGGFDPSIPLKDQTVNKLAWDRELVSMAFRKMQEGAPAQIGPYQAIFVGHSPTQMFSSDFPLQMGNIWAMDTGAGWSGRLSIMDVDSKEYWQSDPTPALYGVSGRNFIRH
ncbi:MAG: metallophosphoesterase [Candidatus Omnitrophica bacterium]|nr:metallophosphoesterase [Candidatus Omnitrophota bacterium]